MSAFPLIVAHRGLTANDHENTIPAFAAAADLGVDMVELDVHETADGEFIVYHNFAPRLWGPRWHRMTYHESRRHARDIHHGPRLSAVTAAVQTLSLYVEIKILKDPNRLCSYLIQSPLPTGSVIASSNIETLQSLHQAGCAYPLLLVMRPHPHQYVAMALRTVVGGNHKRMQSEFLAGVSLHNQLARRRLIQTLHENGKKVFVWTVNRRRRMVKLARWGVDAIVSDVPDALLALRRAQGGTGV